MYTLFRSKLWGLALFGAMSVMSGSTEAAVTQPNGQAVPVGTALQNYLNGSANNNNINENINAQRDAQTEPQKFSPLCDFSGRYVAKGGGANFAIGWYNIDDTRANNNPPKYVPINTGAGLNTAAANSDIQILFPFSASLPPANMLDLTAASIRSSPAYKGGLIGFALVPNPNGTGTGNATQYHYTEHRFSTNCTLCSAPGPWYSTLTYKSNQLANTFYLGFEDLDFLNAAGNGGVNGNDLDYEDFLFRFTGVACVGAGLPCTDMTQQGACQIGVTECDAQGKIFCKNVVKPAQNKETCDGVDNDCNGQVDEGAQCPIGQLCSKGRCADPCGSEALCPLGQECQLGRCIDTGCIGKTCAANQICRAGSCVSPCEGIKCPAPYICSGGLCIDSCVGVTCGQGKVCQNGACVATCDCLPCGSGQACQGATGKCVDQGCQGLTCGTGDVCSKGSCVDPCIGTICPSGQTCKLGKCSDLPPDDGSGGGGGGGPGTDGNPIDGGTVETGCACRFAPAQSGPGAWAMLAGVSILGLAAYRRRRSRRGRY
jgi:MYXO-CTERM domain-containing protein